MTDPVAADTSPHLQPVPGAEHLRWVGVPLRFVPPRRWNTLPVLVATGGADVALVYVARNDPHGELLLTRRLDGAFDRWPPTPGEPVEQARFESGNVPSSVVAWPDGRFILTSHGGLIGRWDAPSARSPGRLFGHATAQGALYVEVVRDGVPVFEHHAGDELERVTPVGPRPPESRNTFAGVAPSGVLWLACVDRAPPRDLPMPLRVDVWRGVPGELRACGSFTCPAGHYPERVLGRAGGGAWIVMRGMAGVAVQGIDAEGRPAASPWQLPFPEHLNRDLAVAPWGDGFAVVIQMPPVALLVSDGVHTTRVHGASGGDPPMNCFPSIAVAPSGRSILVAYQTIHGFEVARADVGPAPAGGEGASDPWAADRAAIAKREAYLAARAANPPPPTPPGEPVDESDPDAPCLPLLARVVRQARLRAMLDAVATLHGCGEATLIAGDATSGTYASANGSGGHVAVAWAPEGAVAVAYEHDCNDEHDVAPEHWNPGRHFPRVPEGLAPVIERAIAAANRQVTGVLWVTRGPGARFEQRGAGTEALLVFVRRAEDVVSSEGEPASWTDFVAVSRAQAELAVRLVDATASGARHPVSAEESDVLLAPPPDREGIAAEPARVARGAAMLERLGVDWPGAAERARAVAEDDSDRGYALLDAIAQEDVAAVKALIAEGANLEKRSRPGQAGRRRARGGATPLMVAIERKNVAIATLLLDAGAALPGGGGAALGAAAHAGSRPLFELLLARGADFDVVREGIFFNAVRGRSADVIDLVLDRGAETRMSLGWYEDFEAVARASDRLDLLERLPRPEHVKQARANIDALARTTVRRSQDDVRRYLRLRHVLIAMRGIHAEIAATSLFEGTHEEGRHAWATPDGRRETVAWSAHGMVAWASVPGEDVMSVDEVIVGLPAPLRELAEATARWPAASSRLSGGFWLHPGAAAVQGLSGWWGDAPGPFADHRRHATSAMDPRTSGWPPDALLVRRELATRAYVMAGLSTRGQYPSITETDAALMLEPPPGDPTATVRAEGVAAAVALLAQLGISWADAEGLGPWNLPP